MSGCNGVFNSLRLRDAYMRRWTRSSLVQIMACRLLGAKPLSEPMLTYSQLGLKEQNSVKYQSKWEHFHSRKCDFPTKLSWGRWVKLHNMMYVPLGYSLIIEESAWWLSMAWCLFGTRTSATIMMTLASHSLRVSRVFQTKLCQQQGKYYSWWCYHMDAFSITLPVSWIFILHLSC